MDKTKLSIIMFVVVLVIIGVFLMPKSNNYDTYDVNNNQVVTKTEETSESTKKLETKQNNECTPAIGQNAGTIEYGNKTYGIVAIGSQQWFKENLNIGIMADPADNDKIEKWCYKNNETNCKLVGALYDKDEAMQYSSKEGAQGICPAGWHIPTDNDWKILETSLCMSQKDIDNQGWRGEDQGTQIKVGGKSGFNAVLAGYRADNGKYYYRDSLARFLSSTQEDGDPFGRDLRSNKTGIFRGVNTSISGYSVRCIKD